MSHPKQTPTSIATIPGDEREARAEDAYRNGLRIALRDRVLTKGLAPSRAHELLVQAEAEAGVA